MTNRKIDEVDQGNAKVLADLIADSGTTDSLRVKIITKLLESREGQDFFKTIYEEGLSFGKCPECDHQNHWAIPEDVLNQMGWTTYENDPRVLKTTNEETCPDFQEACIKKRIII